MPLCGGSIDADEETRKLPLRGGSIRSNRSAASDGTLPLPGLPSSFGSAFVTFGVWPADAFRSSGEVVTYAGRRFCPSCGARVFTDRQGSEAEIRIGSLDGTPEGLLPSYEVWVKRRQPWLPALPWADQFDKDRPPVETQEQREEGQPP